GLVAIDQRGAAERRPAAGQEQVLDRNRHTVEQAQGLAFLPARLRGARGLECTLGIAQRECVELGLEPREPAQDCLGHGDWRQGLLGEAVDQVGGGEEGELAVGGRTRQSTLLCSTRGFPEARHYPAKSVTGQIAGGSGPVRLSGSGAVAGRGEWRKVREPE